MDPYTYRQLSAYDIEPLKQLLEVFGVEFGKEQRHLTYIPDESHVRALLARPHSVCLVAEEGDLVVGGLVAYQKERSENKPGEMYIFDIAVRNAHRDRGIVSRLGEELRAIARIRGVRVIFAQVDRGEKTAVKLYELFGTSEETNP